MNYTVYIHENKINFKKYVGITSQTVNRRWRDGKGYKINTKIRNAFNKYGFDNFNHYILCNDVTKEYACELEQILIKFYNTNNRKFGYNITPGGEVGSKNHTVPYNERKKRSDRMTGRKLSKETKNKISIGNKGKVMSKESIVKIKRSLLGNQNAKGRTCVLSQDVKDKISKGHIGKNTKPIVQFDKNGEFIKEWCSLSDASRSLCISISSISQVLNGIRRTAGGFVFKYKIEKDVFSNE